MPKRKGTFIVIEGTDGSGKTVQFQELVGRLKAEDVDVVTFDFPQYGKLSSYFVREYLNGQYGTWQEVGPYKASVFYALDRYDVGWQLRRWLDEGRVIVANRYVASNMGHQGAKIPNLAKRKRYFTWLAEFEYKILEIPKPDCTIVLHVPAVMAQKLVDKKGQREYIGGIRRDLHEADLTHLKQAERSYVEMVRLFPKDFQLVECVRKGKLLPIPAIHEEVWRIVRMLVSRPHGKS